MWSNCHQTYGKVKEKTKVFLYHFYIGLVDTFGMMTFLNCFFHIREKVAQDMGRIPAVFSSST